MTKRKTFSGRFLPMLMGLVLAFLLAAVPVYAAGEDPADTGETEASVTFTPGQLKLLSVPYLNFGTREISDSRMEYTAQSVGPDVHVSDLRGNGAGWDLMVSLSAFRLVEEDLPTLQGATITIKNPTVTAVNDNKGTPPAAVAEVVLTSDGTETPVLQAGKTAGMGVWGLTWNAADTVLTVNPGTAQQGENAATLTWSLQSAP